ncbi:MAG: asparagine synthetase B [Candidatus Korarchaeota archaeon]|nr:asparagine synthetase B [Candidatus Korarchaeota archaeon]NIU82478.1 hypothetical protein [Candidatus Thorarchaeota archaeon]NIW12964.1 hypothetical protein [Candidatus Thorarchaeota archaeon]NIW51117.1 hypothetical protein [Candidatus Korarchaeota archaeon]
MFVALFTNEPKQWSPKIHRSSFETEVDIEVDDFSGYLLGDKWLYSLDNFAAHSPVRSESFQAFVTSGDPIPRIAVKKTQNSIIIARDYLGFHPLYFAENSSAVVFSSRKSVLWRLGFEPERVKASQILEIRSPGRIFKKKRGYSPPILRDITKNESMEETIYATLKKTISSSISKLKPKKIALAYSGGIDSSLIALATSEVFDGKLFLITVGTPSSHDRKAARESVRNLNIEAEHVEINLNVGNVEKDVNEVVRKIESPSPLQLEIAVPFFYMRKKAEEIGVDLVLAGQGADELFLGYHKFVRAESDRERLKLEQRMLRNMARRNLERDYKVFYPFPVVLPFLSKKMIATAAKIPLSEKITTVRKKPLRDTLQFLGYPTLSQEKKKAVQYGTNAKTILVNIAKKRNMKGITQLANEEFNICFGESVEACY